MKILGGTLGPIDHPRNRGYSVVNKTSKFSALTKPFPSNE